MIGFLIALGLLFGLATADKQHELSQLKKCVQSHKHGSRQCLAKRK